MSVKMYRVRFKYMALSKWIAMLNAYFILQVSKNMKVLCYNVWCVIQNLFSLNHKNVL